MHSRGRVTASSGSAAEAARGLFGALASREPDAVAACFAPDGVERSNTGGTHHGPEQIRSHFAELFAAYPDLQYVVIDLAEDGDRATLRYQAVGTFSGSRLAGLDPTGERLRVDGLETIEVRDGLIHRLDDTVERRA